MNYDEYIAGQRVIFVGSCPNLLGKRRADFIHSYDIVVRTNGSFPVPDAYRTDYGMRCDVLYVNNQFRREMRPLDCALYRRNKLRWLCGKRFSGSEKKTYRKYLYGVRDIVDVGKSVSSVLPSATMGTMILTDILRFRPAELYVTGVDWFASRKPVFEHDNYREYLPTYLPDRIRAKGNIINAGKQKDGHDFYGNADYFYHLFSQYPGCLRTDANLKDLLERIVRREVKQGEISW